MTSPESTTPWHYRPSRHALEGRIIAVTGAAAGIGRALSLSAARLGASVILLDKSIKELETLYDEIEDTNAPQPAIIPIDMAGATAEDYQDIARAIDESFGRLDGLVNNAGWLGAYTPIAHYDLKLYQQIMTVNLHAPFLLTQNLLPLLEKSEDASVVFSTHQHDTAYCGAFGIAKAGLETLMKILADEYDTENPIRFNGVDTGTVNTQMRRMNFPGEDWSRHPAPEEVIAPYLYFLSGDSRGITGSNCRRPAADR